MSQPEMTEAQIAEYDALARECGGQTYAEVQASNAAIQARIDSGELQYGRSARPGVRARCADAMVHLTRTSSSLTWFPSSRLWFRVFLSASAPPSDDESSLSSSDSGYERDPNEIRDEREQAMAWVDQHPEAVQRAQRRLDQIERPEENPRATAVAASTEATAASSAGAAFQPAAAATPMQTPSAAGDGRVTAYLTGDDLSALMGWTPAYLAAVEERCQEMQAERRQAKEAAKKKAAAPTAGGGQRGTGPQGI
jgi:hypothetical protein